MPLIAAAAAAADIAAAASFIATDGAEIFSLICFR